MSSSLPKAIIYDVTHDNQSTIERWNSRAVLPLVCAISMANVPIGTTRGVDEFLPKNLSVITEKRLYHIKNNDVGSYAAESDNEAQEIEFVFNKKAEKVTILGTFNNWNALANPMTLVGPEKWSTTLRLFAGTYSYKFIVNGHDWLVGPGPTMTDGGGHVNNVIVIEPKLPKIISSKSKTKIFESLQPIRIIINQMHEYLGTHKTTLKIYNMVSLNFSYYIRMISLL